MNCQNEFIDHRFTTFTCRIKLLAIVIYKFLSQKKTTPFAKNSKILKQSLKVQSGLASSLVKIKFKSVNELYKSRA